MYCRLMYPACAILLSVACPALPCFSTLSHKRHEFMKQLVSIKCVLIFSTIFVWNISHSKINSAKYLICTWVFVSSTRYSCQISLKREFSGHIFEKYSNIKFHENPSSGRRVVPCGRRGIKTDMTKLIVEILRTRLIRISESSLTDGTNDDKYK